MLLAETAGIDAQPNDKLDLSFHAPDTKDENELRNAIKAALMPQQTIDVVLDQMTTVA